jgi:nitrogen fixation protein NifU and related proteins
MISQKIIQIASNTRNAGLNNNFTHKSSIRNSLCGDKIKIELIANKKKIRSMRYEAEACILCEASASLVAKKIKNYCLKKLKKDIRLLKDNIKNKKLDYPQKFREYKYLTTKDNINRTSCVILPLDALLKAFKL